MTQDSCPCRDALPVWQRTLSTYFAATWVTWRGSPDCSPQTVALLGGSSLSAPGEESLDKVQIILCGQIPKYVGDKHSGIVSLSESYFPYVGGIPDLRFLHPDFIVFFFLIETTQLMIKNNTSRASKPWKALGQNLTSITIGQAPIATTVFCCQAGPQAPQDQLFTGLWSVETEQMCLLMRCGMEPLSGLIEIRCPAIRAALQTDGGSMQVPSRWKITESMTPLPHPCARLHFYQPGKMKPLLSPHTPRGQACVTIKYF